MVDEAARHREQPPAEGGGGGEPVGVLSVSEAGGPAGEVVGQHGAGDVGDVGEESARGAVGESVVFEVSDGELDSGVGAVVGASGCGVEVVSVDDEAVVAPVGPQGALGTDKAGAAHHQAQPAGAVEVAGGRL